MAILVFSFGMLGLAGAYQSLLSAQAINEQAADTMAFGNRFWALFQANPGLLAQLGGTGTTSYTSYAAITNAPTALQPLLKDIFINPQATSPTGLSNANVSIALGPDANGNACVTTLASLSCGVTVTISWTVAGTSLDATRRQVFNYQVGI